MTIELVDAASDQITQKQIRPKYSITISGTQTTKVSRYSYNIDRKFGISSLNVELPNNNGEFSPNNNSNIKEGNEIILEEGFIDQTGTEVQMFPKFKGIIRQISTETRGINSMILVTAMDKIVKLQDTDYDEYVEATKTEVTGERLTPNFITGLDYAEATIDSGLTATQVPYKNATSENLFAANAVLTNETRDTTRIISSVNRSNNIITTQSSSDSWAKDDTIRCYTMAQVFDIANTDIADRPPPVLKIVHNDTEKEDPRWDGYEVRYSSGQILLGRPINAVNFHLKLDYHYYSSGNYVEDIIEDLAETEDDYGNTIFASSDLQSDFNTETNKSQDTLTPNYAPVTIDDTTYPAYQIYYLTFDNLITSLTSGDFTVADGTAISSVNNRYGRVILESASNTTVTTSVNYSFKTLQATGVQVNKIDLTAREVGNRFDAINRLRKFVAPNYIIRTKGDGKLWGEYVSQKVNEDYELKLKSGLKFLGSKNIYTRVKLYGKNENPINLCLDDDARWDNQSGSYDAYSYDTELEQTDEVGAFYVYQPDPAPMRLLSDYTPNVYINNVPIDDKKHKMLSQPVAVKVNEEIDVEQEEGK